MLISLALTISLLLQQGAIGAIALETPRQQTERKPYVAPFISMPDPPKLPKVDLNSCPFEGCQFGKWKAKATVVVYSTWECWSRGKK